jgi:aspartyl-tRNA(Asn)/glutamyl-tRNA(Gln) amidotransferase subunit A
VLLQAIAGFDPQDPASVESPPTDYTRALDQKTRRLRLGRPKTMYFETLDPEIDSAVTEAIGVLRELTASVQEIDLPAIPSLELLFVEANAYFSPAVQADPGGFSPGIHSLVEMGGRISAARYSEAKQRLQIVRHAVRQVFNGVDLIVTPTTPDLPVTIEASAAAPPPRGPPLTARNTTPFNIYGLPTVSVNCGFSRAGLPIGLQISGPPLGDATVLGLAHAYQRHTDWHLRQPG